MSPARLLRHLMSPHWRVRHSFPPTALARIEQAIAQSETRHGGQIRFAVEHALDTASLLRGLSARERALDVFSALKVWDTEHNNGVLIYLLLADRDVEIIADRGIHGRVGGEGWETICREMESAFRGGNFEQGVLSGIERVSSLLESHYPSDHRGPNELPDRPVVL
ncbi:MAG: TPM domain-containing protein [Betaproteobacteria bacterium]|nr:TPM domain-containing protein [Betaproteobacteria bacterium]